jgi:hypothetical protein
VSADAITLSIPHAQPYYGVARLVVGGLAARLDLSYEQLEDLQLALASVLERDGYRVGDDVTIRLLVEPGRVGLEIGPLDARVEDDLRREREHDGVFLGRLLETLVEDVSLGKDAGGHWLRLEKRVPRARGEPGS